MTQNVGQYRVTYSGRVGVASAPVSSRAPGEQGRPEHQGASKLYVIAENLYFALYKGIFCRSVLGAVTFLSYSLFYNVL